MSLSPLDWYGNGTYLRVAATPVADSVSSVNVANGMWDFVVSCRAELLYFRLMYDVV